MERYLQTPEPSLYRLGGVVIHSGDAGGGHYQSIIRDFQGKYWWFNDQSVNETEKKSMERASFGGSHWGSCAYLLFYVKKGARIDGKDIYLKFRVGQSAAPSAMPDQCAFNRDVMEFVLEFANFSALRDFYFSIFCRSGMGELAQRFTNQLIAAMCDGKRQFVQWLSDHWGTHILPIYQSCSTRLVLQSVLSVMNQTANDDSDEGSTLMHLHVAAWDTCSIDIFPDICGMLRDFLSGSPKRLQFAHTKNWPEILNNVIIGKYGGMAGVRKHSRCQSIVELNAILSESDSTLALLPDFGVSMGQTKGDDVQKLIAMTGGLPHLRLRELEGFVDKWRSSFSLSQILAKIVEMKDDIPSVIGENAEVLVKWLNDKDDAVRQSASELIDVVRRQVPCVLLPCLLGYCSTAHWRRPSVCEC
jgi:hypothetical protein